MPLLCRRRLRQLVTLVVALLAVGSCAARAADTVVTLNFDDGLASQYAHRDILDRHGVKATFLINSAKVGAPGFMTWEQIAQLAAEGHEIGGHTLNHQDLTTLSQAEQQHEVCDDRAALVAHGYAPRSFAYPFGAWNASAKAIVQGCGYETARTTGGTDYPDGPVFAETFPPLDAYTVRAYQLRVDTSLATWQDIVDKTRASGGGWDDIVLHDICVPGPDCDAAGDFAVRADTFEQALDWLATLPDVKVRTTAHALDVAADATAPAIALTAPADGATVVGPVALTADASDAVGVARVEFLINGVPVGSDVSAPYAVGWDASGLLGPATVTATAIDEAGNLQTSTARTVLPDTLAPMVALTTPGPGDRVTGRVTLTAVASDNVAVHHVEFLIDGVVVGTDATPPYVFVWDSSRAGSRATLSVRAVDANGNVTQTPPHTVLVAHPPQKSDDRVRPHVRIVALKRNGRRVTVRIAARDADGIRTVRLLLRGRVVRSDTRAPFVLRLRLRPGRYPLAVEAIDRMGNRARTAVRSVSVPHARSTRSHR